MELFLSWSGKKSQKIAEELKTWIPTVIQAVKPFYSSDDIAKGKRWSSELATKLENTSYGIIIMTAENVKAPWILFEAGALSKNIDTGRVCTILFGVKETDLQGPLGQFQNTKYQKSDILKLLKDINSLLEDNSIENKVLEKIFGKMWGDLEIKINEILDSGSEENATKELRSDRELLEEVLRLTRKIQYRHLYRDKSDENHHFLGSKMSNVVFKEETESITFYLDDREKYSIHLSQLYNTGHVLDFIFQVNRKGWANERHIKGFVDCLEELSQEYFGTNAQGIFCPSGSTMKLDWTTRNKVRMKVVPRENETKE